MYRITVVDVTKLPNSLRKSALQLLSASEKHRYEQFRKAQDADLFLFGRYLTRWMIADIAKKRIEDISIIVDGIAEKPYEAHGFAAFSITHSGKFVAVAVGVSKSVGIDIQVHDQQTTDVFDQFFTDQEQAYARQSRAHFYLVWTAIESLAKVTGLGFNEALAERVPHIQNAIDRYSLHHATYFVYPLMQDALKTLTVTTTEPVQFKKVTHGDFGFSSITYAGKTLSGV